MLSATLKGTTCCADSARRSSPWGLHNGDGMVHGCDQRFESGAIGIFLWRCFRNLAIYEVCSKFTAEYCLLSVLKVEKYDGWKLKELRLLEVVCNCCVFFNFGGSMMCLKGMWGAIQQITGAWGTDSKAEARLRVQELERHSSRRSRSARLSKMEFRQHCTRVPAYFGILARNEA